METRLSATFLIPVTLESLPNYNLFIRLASTINLCQFTKVDNLVLNIPFSTKNIFCMTLIPTLISIIPNFDLREKKLFEKTN